MAGAPKIAKAVPQKLLGVLCKYTSIVFHWKLKFLKTRVQKCKQCRARKKLSKAQGALGAEIYGLYKQGETGWEGMPLVRECLKIVEEAEAKIFAYDEAIERLNEDFAAKVEKIKAKYASGNGTD